MSWELLTAPLRTTDQRFAPLTTDYKCPKNFLCTQAWLLNGLTGNIPGALEYSGGRIALKTAERCIFDVPLAEVKNVKFPWHYFGGGVQFRVGNSDYRLSFVQPNDADEIPYHLLAKTDFGEPDALAGAGIREGRRAGQAWKEILGVR